MKVDNVNQDHHGRKMALLSYWIVFLVGIPVWWMMTRIERHALPVHAINNIISRSQNIPTTANNDNIRVKGYPGYQISFTVISKDDNCVSLHNAYQKHFAGPLAQLSETIAYFKVDMQCRLHAVPAGSSLETFVKSEWNLANSISSLPVINFVVYMKGDEEKEYEHKSFVYPQWGAVYIYEKDDSPDNIMKAFLSHLMALLGIKNPSDLTEWLADEQIRCHKDALSSLRSLLNILDSCPNMPVPKQVSEAVHKAVSFLEKVQNEDGSQMERFGWARNALDAAEAAFFHPAMLARQYFPQEHILAVYVPLFVPLLMPLVVQTVKTFKER